jgi:predicted exporter
VFEKGFSLFNTFVRQHKKCVLLLVLVVTAAAGTGLFFTSYEGNIDLMLPPDKEIARSMDFLRGSSFSDKMIVSVTLTDPAKTKKDLFLAVDQLSASLTPPLFMKVVSGFSVANVMDEFSILQYAPQVLGTQDLETIAGLINFKTVSQKMRGIYLQSMRPESVFTSSMSRSDPLGIKMLLLEKMRALPASMGYDVTIEDGHFISRDGRHAMMIIQTSVAMMDSPRSKELVAKLQERIKELPEYITADIVSGHLHTVSNERVIKRDITIVSTIASVTFLCLFLLVFRDPRVLFVFIIPFIAIVWAIILASIVEGRLLYLVIGLGTAIAGFSVDYGLHVYIAMKRGVDSTQFVKLSRLVTINATTTMFSFLVLYFSQIHGYHQLALFSALCVFFCLMIALFVLPLFLSNMKLTSLTGPNIDDKLRSFRWPVKLCIGTWGVLLLLALYSSLSVTFDSDVKKLDGSGPEVLRAEQTFQDVWGGRTSQAIFVVSGKSLEEAMEVNDSVFHAAHRLVVKGDFTSLAQFWPSEKLRMENSARWDVFWKQGKEDTLKKLIRETSAPYRFSESAFSPFFNGLYLHRTERTSSNGLIAQLQDRFVLNKNGEYRILSYFPDEQNYIDSLKEITKKYPSTFIVSGKAMSASISSFTAKEIKILAPLAFLSNVLLAWLFFGNWKYTLIALVPLVTGVVWFVGIMSFLKIPLNVINIVASIVSTGVIVDYGLGITYQYRHNLRTGTILAVTLSATTNIIGTGALLFAKHPALYSTGVAMFICIMTGYLSAIMVVPPLCSLIETTGSKYG